MNKDLSEMTLEELWDLFPIFLINHSDKWDQYYAEMEFFLKNILSDCMIVRISHIGSTAINGICSKNIVDILLEIDSDEDIEKVATLTMNNGFILMSSSPTRISLNMGYTSNGFAEKVYHLHIRYHGDNDELYFRDYLNEHPDVAKDYEKMKLSLCKKYEHNRDAYTSAKSAFVHKWTIEAKKVYIDRF